MMALIEQGRLDVRQAWRSWRRSPAIAVAMIILPALGIGGVAALFSPLYSLVLAPLPFPHSEQLVRIGGDLPLFNGYTNTFVQRERLTAIFTNLMAYSPVDLGGRSQVRLMQNGPLEDVNVQRVTAQFFETLGVRPLVGTTFEGESDGSAVAVLSNRVARSESRASGDALGTQIQLFGHSFTVVGIMPESFDFPIGTDVWVPMWSIPDSSSRVQFVGRLHGGLSIGQAASSLVAIGHQGGTGSPGTFGREGPILQPLQAFLRGDRRSLLWVLWAVSILFMLLASAGAANLLLAQGVRRRPEMVVRLALGARRSRLVWQLLTETLLVVALGGLLAIWVSTVSARWLHVWLPDLRGGQTLVPATVALVAGLAVIVTIICGLAPALYTTGASVAQALRAGGNDVRRNSAKPRVFSPREFLASVQLVLALVLLICAGLLVRSLAARMKMSVGLQAKGVAVVQSVLPPLASLVSAKERFYTENGMDPHRSYGPRTHFGLMQKMQRALEPEERARNTRNMAFFGEAEQELAQLGGVMSIGVIDPPPFTPTAHRAIQNPDWVAKISPSGTRQRSAFTKCIVGRASPNAFDVLGVRLVLGRTFTNADIAAEFATREAIQFSSAEPGVQRKLSGVAIINEVLARRLWPNENPIGKQFYDRGAADRTVVGVVSYFHQSGYSIEMMPAAYYPFIGVGDAGSLVARLRSDVSVEKFRADADQVLRRLTRDAPRIEVQSMQLLSDQSTANLRLALVFLSCFSILGVVVAGLGVYAAATLMAAARAREAAIRMALGASAREIRLLALWRSMRLALIAFPVGLFLAWGVARQLAAVLFQVGATDPVAYLVSGVFLGIVVLVAGSIPALRAASTEPASLLHCE